MGVADGNQRLASFAFGVGGGDQPFMYLADTAQVVVTQVRAGHFRRAQEGQCQAPRGDLAFGIRQWNQQAFGVQLAVIEPQHAPESMGAQTAHQRCRQLDARTGIVVAGDHHNGQLGVLLVGADDEVIQPLLCLERRVDRVEDIAGDQQHIGMLGADLAQQPFQETSVFVVAFLAVEVLAKVPVGGVEQTQGELREKNRKVNGRRIQRMAVKRRGVYLTEQ